MAISVPLRVSPAALRERRLAGRAGHIYRKVGVRSRSAAVARMFGAVLAAHEERTS